MLCTSSSTSMRKKKTFKYRFYVPFFEGPTEQLVSPEPEFYMKRRESDKDEFLVLACDGVWDVMTNEDICSFISARMRVTDNLEQIANEVIDTCLHKVITKQSTVWKLKTVPKKMTLSSKCVVNEKSTIFIQSCSYLALTY